MQKFIFMLLLAFVSVGAAAAEWLCIAETFAGFKYESGKWKAATGPSQQKYVVAMATENEIRAAKLLQKSPPVWMVKGFGQPYGMSCGDFNEQDMLLCRDDKEFSFNKKTGRFLYIYPVGYVGVASDEIGTKLESSHSPEMIMGKCHPMAAVDA